jgi:hypothetical protein
LLLQDDFEGRDREMIFTNIIMALLLIKPGGSSDPVMPGDYFMPCNRVLRINHRCGFAFSADSRKSARKRWRINLSQPLRKVVDSNDFLPPKGDAFLNS